MYKKKHDWATRKHSREDSKQKMDAKIILYESINVWRRTESHEIVCYRCFQNLRSRRYVVQSSDFYPSSPDSARSQFFDKQYLELFGEQSPDERSPSFDTLEEAILAHDDHLKASA